MTPSATCGTWCAGPRAGAAWAAAAPATTPRGGWQAWRVVTAAADPRLDALDEAAMLRRQLPGSPPRQLGTAILRVTYHYWFHTGEILAIRQLLDHPNRPEYGADSARRAPYRSMTAG